MLELFSTSGGPLAALVASLAVFIVLAMCTVAILIVTLVVTGFVIYFPDAREKTMLYSLFVATGFFAIFW